ncbi:MAG: xanthine dehydrogenase family protein subunit M, partial [Novosphingobium sp.]
MGPTPVAMAAAEAALVGQSPAGIDATAVADLAVQTTAPFNDSHASAEYRRTVGRRLFEKGLRAALYEKEVA